MDRERQPRVHRTVSEIGQLEIPQYGDSEVVERSLVRLTHESGAGAKRAIGEELHAAHPKAAALVTTRGPARDELIEALRRRTDMRSGKPPFRS